MTRTFSGWMAALALAIWAPAAAAQQAVRLALPPEAGAAAINATFLKSASTGRAPAVLVLHGCGGIGQNHLRMAQNLVRQGYAALLPDSFGGRAIRDACTRNWPSVADAERRTYDIDAGIAWLSARSDIASDRIAVIGYSYGGGVLLLRALRPKAPAPWRSAIAVYPDCALPDPSRSSLEATRPLMLALAELDDWTPVHQCRSLLQRVTGAREQIESREYAGAHHSFDAVGLPVTWLGAAGNRSKPNNCCGAHYGHHPAAWRQFVSDVDAFLERTLRR